MEKLRFIRMVALLVGAEVVLAWQGPSLSAKDFGRLESHLLCSFVI